MPEPIKMMTLAEYKAQKEQVATALKTAEKAKGIAEDVNDTLTNAPHIYYGTTEPSSNLGKDGDLYFQYEEENTETEA